MLERWVGKDIPHLFLKLARPNVVFWQVLPSSLQIFHLQPWLLVPRCESWPHRNSSLVFKKHGCRNSALEMTSPMMQPQGPKKMIAGIFDFQHSSLSRLCWKDSSRVSRGLIGRHPEFQRLESNESKLSLRSPFWRDALLPRVETNAWRLVGACWRHVRTKNSARRQLRTYHER
jgi:hypothetical protein